MTKQEDSIETLVARLEALRRAEKEQALFYRALAARAEETDPPTAGRFHDLHADEQHHLSRLTARVLELGGRPVDLSNLSVKSDGEGGWREVIAARELQEIERYQEALSASEVDETTRALLRGILEVEEHHASELGGKWTMA